MQKLEVLKVLNVDNFILICGEKGDFVAIGSTTITDRTPIRHMIDICLLKNACGGIPQLKVNFTEASCLFPLLLDKTDPLINANGNDEIMTFDPGGEEFLSCDLDLSKYEKLSKPLLYELRKIVNGIEDDSIKLISWLYFIDACVRRKLFDPGGDCFMHIKVVISLVIILVHSIFLEFFVKLNICVAAYMTYTLGEHSSRGAYIPRIDPQFGGS